MKPRPPTHGSSLLKRPASPRSRPPSDPLERAQQAAEDARDIARDELRRLPDYGDDSEEITANHQHAHFTVNLTAPGASPSQPDIKVETEAEISLGPAKAKVPPWVVVVVGIGGIAVTALVTKLLG